MLQLLTSPVAAEAEEGVVGVVTAALPLGAVDEDADALEVEAAVSVAALVANMRAFSSSSSRALSFCT